MLTDGRYTYLYGHAHLGQESAAGMAYYLTDALGSVRQLADASSVTLSRAYEPYGEELSSSGSGTTSYGFTGEWTENQTGLIYLRARHYAPGTGRFISQDPWQGSARQPMSYNAWLYAYANPVTWMDPSGLKADDPPAPPRFGGWNSKCYPLVREDRLACEKMIRGINPDETSLSEQLILYLGSIRDCPGDFARYFNPPRLPRSYNNDTRQYGYWYHWLAENVAGWWNNQKSSHVELQQLVAIAYGREVSTLIDHEIPRIYVAEAFARKTWSEGFYFYIGSRQTVQTIVEYGLFGRDCDSEPGDRTEGCDYRYSPDKFRGQMSTQFGPSSMAYTMAESILYRTDWRRKASNRPWEFGNPTANSSQMLIRALDSKSGDSYDQVLYKSKSWLERKDTKLRTSSGTVIYDIFFIVTPGQQHNLCAGGSCIYP